MTRRVRSTNHHQLWGCYSYYNGMEHPNKGLVVGRGSRPSFSSSALGLLGWGGVEPRRPALTGLTPPTPAPRKCHCHVRRRYSRFFSIGDDWQRGPRSVLFLETSKRFDGALRRNTLVETQTHSIARSLAGVCFLQYDFYHGEVSNSRGHRTTIRYLLVSLSLPILFFFFSADKDFASNSRDPLGRSKKKKTGNKKARPTQIISSVIIKNKK